MCPAILGPPEVGVFSKKAVSCVGEVARDVENSCGLDWEWGASDSDRYIAFSSYSWGMRVESGCGQWRSP